MPPTTEDQAAPEPTPEQVNTAYKKLDEDAESGGYHLNPDVEWTKGLVRGLLINTQRYGYQSCPCRLASGNKADDLDIICPCDYRDPDLQDYGACYCALYVSDAVLSGEQELRAVPERRPPEKARTAQASPTPPPEVGAAGAGAGPSPAGQAPRPRGGNQLWRCRVCGYLCAREHPPLICPVCKAKQDRFEEFVLPVSALPTGQVAGPSPG